MKEISHHLTKKVQKGLLTKEAYHSYREKAEANIPKLESACETIKVEPESNPLHQEEEMTEEVEAGPEEMSAFQVMSPFFHNSSGMSEILETFKPIDFGEELFDESG